MAKDKKSFILYADLITVVKKLVLQDRENKTNYAGELFLHVLEYVNDKNPIPINFIVDMAFEPIKLQLKRDLKKYEHIRGVRSELGKKGAETKKQNKANQAIADLAEAKQAVSDTVIVTDSVTVNDNVTDTVKDLKDFGVLENSDKPKKEKVVKEKKDSGAGAKKNDVHSLMVASWYEYNEKLRGIKPSGFTGSDGAAMKKIRERIKSIIENPTDETVLDFWKVVLNEMPAKSNWISKQNLSVINSKFDTLITDIKNFKNATGKKTGFNTAEEIEHGFNQEKWNS